jgi:uncharacterized protein (TIGR03083 family)
MSPEDVRAATEAVAAAIAPAVKTADWDTKAGTLKWTCRETLAHTVDCVTWYGALLARRSPKDIETPEIALQMPLKVMVDALRSMGAVLAEVVKGAEPSVRAFHPYGLSDATGFAAMGCDEMLVHGYDIAGGLGIDYDPPSEVVEHTLHRLFPWAPTDADPWQALLWANGRTSLGDRKPERKWLWQCAPLDEWNGEIRRMPK